MVVKIDQVRTGQYDENYAKAGTILSTKIR